MSLFVNSSVGISVITESRGGGVVLLLYYVRCSVHTEWPSAVQLKYCLCVRLLKFTCRFPFHMPHRLSVVNYMYIVFWSTGQGRCVEESKKYLPQQLGNGYSPLFPFFPPPPTPLCPSLYSLVIDTLKSTAPDRKCFRMVGGVLVERTVKDVLPALEYNHKQVYI